MRPRIRRPGPAMRDRTTLRLGGTTRAEAVLRADADLDMLPPLLHTEGASPLALGAGSNLLCADQELPLLLLTVDNQRAPEARPGDDHVTVRVGGGVKLPVLLGWCARNGLSGLENLTGIPGTVGGAVAMNAGSYGSNMADLVRRVRVWTPEAGLEWRNADQCRFDYRFFAPEPLDGDAPTFFLIWEAELALVPSLPDNVRAAMRYTMTRKKAAQPVTAWSAGCVFKNPENQSAGILLDKAGFRGLQQGGMAFSSLHANFLVNLGQGTAEQALELLEKARYAVYERFGVTLETEVRVIA
ncbi:UDP-N-acetylmuramate dehydrogenase [Paucidesulfovibrio gracilis DSM 16080]|uniref:UDP-N-acetylenolpyruvoylglucosamine reductase n=1 Tax=Paucidesulfovibrio gracilis DSM 16080 TaxID=1121449 RepID=A0A1T4W550_9BACT|nr:UDP-N-acetylmuramate dehydrogenase [Paucidesulfovibrio gracilis]SKA72386.1 UDP-N-acetylmuramate dehydrogenase [Paucidesulfovibrio gracilis DSM 16080]